MVSQELNLQNYEIYWLIQKVQDEYSLFAKNLLMQIDGKI